MTENRPSQPAQEYQNIVVVAQSGTQQDPAQFQWLSNEPLDFPPGSRIALRKVYIHMKSGHDVSEMNLFVVNISDFGMVQSFDNFVGLGADRGKAPRGTKTSCLGLFALPAWRPIPIPDNPGTWTLTDGDAGTPLITTADAPNYEPPTLPTSASLAYPSWFSWCQDGTEIDMLAGHFIQQSSLTLEMRRPNGAVPLGIMDHAAYEFKVSWPVLLRSTSGA